MPFESLRAFRRGVRLAKATARGRLRAHTRNPPSLVGAFPDYASAMTAVPKNRIRGCDNEEVAEVPFELMCQVTLWDYPVIHWLNLSRRKGLRLVDAGGHLGTKYIAFEPLLPVTEFDWTVYDLPAIVEAGRNRQKAGALPAGIGFESDLGRVGPVDLLLGSGLLQYLDIPFAELVARLPNRPERIVLNKVATREGPTVVALERVGNARMPYQIRNRAAFEAGFAQMGYALRDQWEIPPLSRVIGTHPALGQSVSRGYVLDRID
ncbi:methyltransferase, TIGR04325 family [Acidimangrovimonas pyrenivorans]|uniref:Methyltransferase, TIGR04325 family n=1 Tax=Acidimangrovimonas pyrenivorans TaxID=2030798 RepID=A0ABV7ACA5_9RHOB